jgi:hypothetical protein
VHECHDIRALESGLLRGHVDVEVRVEVVERADLEAREVLG